MPEKKYKRPDQSIINEAKALHEAAGYCSDFELCEQIQRHVWKLIEPLIEKKNPDALFLKCMMTTYSEGSGISNEEYNDLYLKYLREAADAGSIDAKFRLACELDEDKTREEASSLFKEAAESGHPYAMWCHGLNLYGGTGQKQNKERGREYIKKAADLKCVLAIRFLSEVYASGLHGFLKDETKSALYWQKLKDKDLIA